jgi:hypothetical protein
VEVEVVEVEVGGGKRAAAAGSGGVPKEKEIAGTPLGFLHPLLFLSYPTIQNVG